MKRVSAGKGPIKSTPLSLSDSQTGEITSSSSNPSFPDSPECGLRPETNIRGPAMRNTFLNASLRIINLRVNNSCVISCGTCFNGRWVVASATRIFSEANIITTSSTSVRSAKYSVCPVKGIPPSFITDF